MENDKSGVEWIDYISVPTWCGHGSGMLRNRECLGYDNPDQTYNYIKRKLQEAYDSGIKMDDTLLKPENFGIKNPRTEMFNGQTRDDLMDEIIELRELVDSYEFNQVPFKCSPLR